MPTINWLVDMSISLEGEKKRGFERNFIYQMMDGQMPLYRYSQIRWFCLTLLFGSSILGGRWFRVASFAHAKKTTIISSRNPDLYALVGFNNNDDQWQVDIVFQSDKIRWTVFLVESADVEGFLVGTFKQRYASALV